jgi:hypothetical protein
MDLVFKSERELYDRLKPCLTAKKSEMIRNDFTYIKEEDIWNYLKITKWQKAEGLSLADMANDVLNTDNLLIDQYLKKELRTMKRKRYLEEDDINEQENESI